MPDELLRGEWLRGAGSKGNGAALIGVSHPKVEKSGGKGSAVRDQGPKQEEKQNKKLCSTRKKTKKKGI